MENSNAMQNSFELDIEIEKSKSYNKYNFQVKIYKFEVSVNNQLIMERINSCDQCESSTNRSSHLKRQLKHMHEGVSYPCEKCEYAETTLVNLRKHKQS